MRGFLLPLLVLAGTITLSTGMLTFGISKKLVDSARRYNNRERDMFETRASEGLDIRAEDFHEVGPEIFEMSPDRVTDIHKNSHMINWMGYEIKRDNIQATPKGVIDFFNLPKHLATIYCPYEAPGSCAKSKFRTLDGSCNNLKHPLRGAAFTPFARDLQPVYEETDEESVDDYPRTMGVNGPLPGARLVSRTVHQVQPSTTPKVEISSIFTFWGQFIAHMVTDRAIASGFNNTRIDCCAQTEPTPGAECFNIPIPGDDPFRQQGRTCMGFLRSLEATDINCNGVREQLNVASSYVDGSAVYGVETDKADFLRTGTKGQLATSAPNELPFRAHINAIAAKSGFSFVQAGDPRAPEVAPLTGMHTIWVREHNRIAQRLSTLNPNWKDNKLYQESRRIVIAMIQHITYNEWLPILVGPGYMNEFNLSPFTGTTHFKGYDENVDASTPNSIATAAFRFGHSLIPDIFPLVKKDYSLATSPALKLVDIFFRPNQYLLHEQSLMRGLLVDSTQSMDSFLSPTLTSQLFQIHHGQGMDLAALNIQRGRDHGLPSYNKWRKSLGLSVANSFTSGAGGFKDIPNNVVQALARVYSNPDDVDLWTGGVSETPVSGGVLGPLFGKMLARQFQRYKKGDRYWYETATKPQAFTTNQLQTIRRMTMSRVICNTFDVDVIQPHTFRLNTASGNSRVACSSLKTLKLVRWRV